MNEKNSKPCPFCGYISKEPRYEILCINPIPPLFSFCCFNANCNAMGPVVSDVTRAIEAWNRRAK